MNLLRIVISTFGIEILYIRTHRGDVQTWDWEKGLVGIDFGEVYVYILQIESFLRRSTLGVLYELSDREGRKGVSSNVHLVDHHMEEKGVGHLIDIFC